MGQSRTDLKEVLLKNKIIIQENLNGINDNWQAKNIFILYISLVATLVAAFHKTKVSFPIVLHEVSRCVITKLFLESFSLKQILKYNIHGWCSILVWS